MNTVSEETSESCWLSHSYRLIIKTIVFAIFLSLKHVMLFFCKPDIRVTPV